MRAVVGLFLLWLLPAWGAGSVRVWEETITLPTYQEGPPDPNPDFPLLSSFPLPNYPYAVRLNMGSTKRDQSWRTLNIENAYLVCRVLPDLGGHLYGCKDKLNGREMFYANPVVRPAHNGLRGSFVAMGIESNFPAAHSRTTTSPVDFATRSNADGSATIVVGDTDQITGMQWRVEYTLHPEEAVLEESVRLYNPTVVRHPYSWWSNAAVETDDPQVRALIPTGIMKVHGTDELLPWPRIDGKTDGSVVTSYPKPVGLFAWGSREQFVGVYKPGTRTGFLEWAEPAIAGKKLFVWGKEGEQEVRDSLTDHSNTYFEVQVGLFGAQDITEFLEPGQVRAFKQYWIPFRNMDGLTRGTRYAVVYVNRQEKGLDVQIVPTAKQNNARVELGCGRDPATAVKANLDPAAVFTHHFATAGTGPCTLRVFSQRGVMLLDHREGGYRTLDPSRVRLGVRRRNDLAGKPNDGFLLARGEAYERGGRLEAAMGDYNKGLQNAWQNGPLHKSAGRVAIAMGRVDDARKHLTLAAQISPTDDEAWYYLGVAEAAAGSDANARTAFSKVRAQSAFYVPALVELTFLDARANDLARAAAVAGALAALPNSPARAVGLQAAILRRQSKKEESAKALQKALALDPASAFLRSERFLLEGKDDGLWAYFAGDPERLLNVTDEYLNLGFYDSALQILDHELPQVPVNQTELGSQPPAKNPLIAYYRAYLRSKTNGDAAAEWTRAAGLPVQYVFPHRQSSYPVLRAALQHNAEDATAHYLLGLLYMSSSQNDLAINEYQAARKSLKNDALARTLGRTLLEYKQDAPAAIAVLKEGAKWNPENADIKTALEKAQSAPVQRPTRASRDAAKSSGLLPEVEPEVKSSPTTELALMAMLRAAAGSVTEAEATFRADPFTKEDQPEEVRQAYAEVQLQKVLSFVRDKRCDQALTSMDQLVNEKNLPRFTGAEGIKKFTRSPHFQYYMGLVEDRCGLDKAAKKRWGRVNANSDRVAGADTVYPLIAAWRRDPAGAAQDLQAALKTVQQELSKAQNASHSWLLFAEGLLYRALGQDGPATADFKRVSETPTDRLAQYLSITEITMGSAK